MKFQGTKEVREEHIDSSLKAHLSLAAKHIHVLEEKNRSLEKRISEVESTCNEGGILWAIDGYHGKLLEAKQAYEKLSGLQKIFGLKENFYSNSFCTSKFGYKLRLCANLHYTAEGNVAFGVQLMKGKYDSILKWPFTLPYEVALLSHGDELRKKACVVSPSVNPNYTRPNDNHNYPLYHVSIIPSVIENGNFIVDDTIYVRCVILKEKGEHRTSSSSSSKKRKYNLD